MSVLEAMTQAARVAYCGPGVAQDWEGLDKKFKEIWLHQIRAALAAAEREGWQLVPREPTADVARAVHDTFAAEDEDRKMLFMGIWLRGHRAMLAASPEAK